MGDAIVRKTDAELAYEKAKSIIDRNEQKIRDALPEIMRANSSDFMRALMVDMHKNPKLATAAASNPIGFVSCVLDGARTGLRFGPFGHLNILPFWSKKTKSYDLSLVIGYKGYNELALGSGKVKGLTKHCVFEGEPFKIEYGTTEKLKHTPRWDVPRTVETCIGAYATAKMETGEVLFKFMTKAEILAVSKDNDVWRDNWEAMFEKTPLRRLANMLPMTPEFQRVIEIDDTHARQRYEALEDSRPERVAALDIGTTIGVLGTAVVQDRAGNAVPHDAVAAEEPPDQPDTETYPGPEYAFSDFSRDEREAKVVNLLRTRVVNGDVEASIKKVERLDDPTLEKWYNDLSSAPVKTKE